MSTPLRFTLIWASFVAAFAALAPFALAGAGTYYASPTGSGVTCAQATPCSLTEAVSQAVNEDSVSLAPGTYVLPGGGLGIAKEIDIGGQPGAAAATVLNTAGGNVHVNTIAKPTLHDMTIEGAGGGLVLNSGIAERLFVSYTGPSSSACSLAVGTVMRDSVCWTHDDGEKGSAAIEVGAPGTNGTVILRNVTALATNSGGNALRVSATGSLSKAVVEGTDVIAHSDHHPDIQVELNGGGLPVVEVKLANSSFATVSGELPPLATVTAPGTNGNQVASPKFVNAASGDLREAVGAPTIDAGVNNPLNGSIDLAGNSRSLAACLGGAPVTDIGAYEFLPVSCAAPMPLAPSHSFTVGKLKRNKKKGTAILPVTVPDAGKFTLSGKGVKKVTRSSEGVATLKLPVKPVGRTKKSLIEKGHAGLSVILRFIPTGGTLGEKETSFKLIEKRP